MPNQRSLGLETANKKGRSLGLRPFSAKRSERLLHHLATNGAECADQSGSQQEQGRRLGSGCAATADNVEGTESLRAVRVPGLAAVGRIQVETVGTRAVVVPSHPAGVILIRRSQYHEVG